LAEQGGTLTRGLNIAALAQRTGVAPDTLRKWEQRYGILRPERTAGGQRRYTERDVARVEWLRARLAEGYRIGEAALLLGSSTAPAAATPREHVDMILAAVDRGEVAEVGLRLDQVFALHRVETVLVDVIAPLLRSVGDLWAAGEVTVAQEHLVSEAVRARLGHLVGDAASGGRGPALLVCAPGERHELGLMTLAVALRNDGWQVVYVGADTPLEGAVELAHRVSAGFIGVSMTLPERAAALARSIRDARLPRGTALVVGGAAATSELAERLGGHYVDGDLIHAVRMLRRFAGQR
jgi:DNA-binding transcriptional MerR regulator